MLQQIQAQQNEKTKQKLNSNRAEIKVKNQRLYFILFCSRLSLIGFIKQKTKQKKNCWLFAIDKSSQEKKAG